MVTQQAMRTIESKHRSSLIDPKKCPLRRNYCIRTNGEHPDKCKYYDHMTERRGANGWQGFTMYCRCDKPQVVQLTLFD